MVHCTSREPKIVSAPSTTHMPLRTVRIHQHELETSSRTKAQSDATTPMPAKTTPRGMKNHRRKRVNRWNHKVKCPTVLSCPRSQSLGQPCSRVHGCPCTCLLGWPRSCFARTPLHPLARSHKQHAMSISISVMHASPVALTCGSSNALACACSLHIASPC